ncbi:MAG: oxygen-independent coproporphyrinogen III oxidase [Saprospiraceae bacterium]|nr:oxygen-independent coproporphyrinogen III oxidase [Saprospiraceae bacterium]
MDTTLLTKYDVAAPRYTSYPTVPYWTAQTMPTDTWLDRVQKAADLAPALSLYVHLPYCDSLCTYCGCNKHITKNHRVEEPYIETLLQEWKLYCAVLPGRPILNELHLGGGTPTFFSATNLRYLIENILKTVDLPEEPDFGFEAHPWSTTKAHLQTLYDLGFRRVSIGVQDFDEDLMKLVNRKQSIASIQRCTEDARAIGYTSINYDLIYGLPRQTPAHIERDADFIAQLMPERIAFYAYAHVPWLKRSQDAYSEADLPTGADKRLLYEIGRARFEALGYEEIGMDHFALPQDSLSKALKMGVLHRNFMGYTTTRSRLMIGLGASAISDTWDAFAQNEKNIADYQRVVQEGRLPVFRGHFLDTEDQLLRMHILNLMTRFETRWTEEHPALSAALLRLEPLLADGLVEIEPMGVKVSDAGRAFLRNICMAFDTHYWQKQPEGRLFSQAV